jgi:hypothetical protein
MKRPSSGTFSCPKVGLPETTNNNMCGQSSWTFSANSRPSAPGGISTSVRRTSISFRARKVLSADFASGASNTVYPAFVKTSHACVRWKKSSSTIRIVQGFVIVSQHESPTLVAKAQPANAISSDNCAAWKNSGLSPKAFGPFSALGRLAARALDRGGRATAAVAA